MLVLVLLIPLLQLFFRYAVAERMGTVLLSAIVAHTAWHWMLDRGGVLRQFRFEWPVLDGALLLTLLHWLMFLVILGGILWLFHTASRWWTTRTTPSAGKSANSTARALLPAMEPATSLEPDLSSDHLN